MSSDGMFRICAEDLYHFNFSFKSKTLINISTQTEIKILYLPFALLMTDNKNLKTESKYIRKPFKDYI